MALLIETPRITAVFRSFLTSQGKSYDYQDEYIHARKEAIEARKKKYSLFCFFFNILILRHERKEKEDRQKNILNWEYFSKFSMTESIYLFCNPVYFL